MIIYRLTDRVPVTIGELKFWVSPLSFEQKGNLLNCQKMEGGVLVQDPYLRAFMSIKYALKSVDGLKTHDGNDYTLKLESSGILSDASVDEIIGLPEAVGLTKACVALMQNVAALEGIPGVVVDFKGVVSTIKKD